MQDSEAKAHPWKPGTLLRLVTSSPLFRNPLVAKSFAMASLACGTVVMYTDCDSTSMQEPARMVQVVHGELIGWIYRDVVYQCKEL